MDVFVGEVGGDVVNTSRAVHALASFHEASGFVDPAPGFDVDFEGLAEHGGVDNHVRLAQDEGRVFGVGIAADTYVADFLALDVEPEPTFLSLGKDCQEEDSNNGENSAHENGFETTPLNLDARNGGYCVKRIGTADRSAKKCVLD